LTWILVILEGASLVAMPLAIGWAVDDLIEKEYPGVIKLGCISLFLLFVGAGRRFYDTRAYAKVYKVMANELVKNEQQQKTPLSKVSARVNLFTEFIHFLENSIPGIIHQFINLFGTLIVIAFIDYRILIACMIAIIITTIIYSFSEKRIFRLNKGGNDEVEKQVDILKSANEDQTHNHFKSLMNWQIKLSDLETINFSLIWMLLTGVLVYSIIAVTSSGNASYGIIASTIMYVFGFIESIISFPLYYQQLIRLQEIASRLANPKS
jgi:ABC-type bacteriocin/lantibiotic exporter with double-glycine peptidase domain